MSHSTQYSDFNFSSHQGPPSPAETAISIPHPLAQPLQVLGGPTQTPVSAHRFLLDNMNAIKVWLHEMGLDNEPHIIHENLEVSVKGAVNLYKKGLKYLPIQFREVEGYFNISGNYLWTLEGSPHRVGEGFNCSYNALTSLKGAPQEVGLDFVCDNNNISDFQGVSIKVGGSLTCSDNPLKNLDNLSITIGASQDLSSRVLPHFYYYSSTPIRRIKGVESFYFSTETSRRQDTLLISLEVWNILASKSQLKNSLKGSTHTIKTPKKLLKI